jgi:hypothetical protein
MLLKKLTILKNVIEILPEALVVEKKQQDVSKIIQITVTTQRP